MTGRYPLFVLAAVASAAVVGASTTVPLVTSPGDPTRGLAAFVDRERGHCLLCHTVDAVDEPFQGNIGPDLSAIGARARADELRQRIVAPNALNPATLMPAYHRIADLHRVGKDYRGKPILTAQEVEDVIAFLLTLGGDDA